MSQPNNGVIKCTVHKGRDREKETQKLHFVLQDLLEETGGGSRGRGWGGAGGRKFCSVYTYPGVLEIFLKKYEKRQNLYATYREGRGQRQKGASQNSVPHTVERYLKQEETSNKRRPNILFLILWKATSNMRRPNILFLILWKATSNKRRPKMTFLIRWEATSNKRRPKHSVPHTLQGLLKKKNKKKKRRLKSSVHDTWSTRSEKMRLEPLVFWRRQLKTRGGQHLIYVRHTVDSKLKTKQQQQNGRGRAGGGGGGGKGGGGGGGRRSLIYFPEGC